MAINLNNTEASKQQVSVRLDNSFLKDIDKIIDVLKKRFGIKRITRNVILELMIKDARKDSKLIVGDKTFSFDELLNLDINNNEEVFVDDN